MSHRLRKEFPWYIGKAGYMLVGYEKLTSFRTLSSGTYHVYLAAQCTCEYTSLLMWILEAMRKGLFCR